jgi:hypothetical protein
MRRNIEMTLSEPFAKVVAHMYREGLIQRGLLQYQGNHHYSENRGVAVFSSEEILPLVLKALQDPDEKNIILEALCYVGYLRLIPRDSNLSKRTETDHEALADGGYYMSDWVDRAKLFVASVYLANHSRALSPVRNGSPMHEARIVVSTDQLPGW